MCGWQWVLVLALAGMPFMIGLMLLVWMHMPWMWVLWYFHCSHCTITVVPATLVLCLLLQ